MKPHKRKGKSAKSRRQILAKKRFDSALFTCPICMKIHARNAPCGESAFFKRVSQAEIEFHNGAKLYAGVDY